MTPLPAPPHTSHRCTVCGYPAVGLEDQARCPECGSAFAAVGRIEPGDLRNDPQAAMRDAVATLAIGIVSLPLVVLPCVDFLLPFVAFGFGALSLYRSVRTRQIIAWPPAIATAGIALAGFALAAKLFVLFGFTFLLN